MKMMKTLIALAVGSCAFSATASDTLEQQIQALNERIAQLEGQTEQAPALLKNSQFSLYGSLRPTLVYQDNDDNDNWKVGDALSRLGVKASTDLGHGWSAFAQGEWKIKINDSGKFGDARLAFAGIASPYGAIALGRQRPVQYTLVAEYVDIFNNANSPFAYNQESPFFVDNFATYKLQTGDFTFIAGAQFNGPKGEDGADMINAGMGYDKDALHLGLSYLTKDTYDAVDTELNTGDAKLLGGVVAYTFSNDLYAAISYQDKDYNFNSGADRSGSTLDTAFAYPIAKDYKIKLGYFQFEDGIKDSTSYDYAGYNATLEWNPASNVRVHLEYVTQDFDNYQDDTQVALGFRYDFNLTWKG